MDLTLVVLAAGMGSRYGGLKQIDAVGPSGESVMDYSVFDALRTGFDHVVCVIRKSIEREFRAAVSSRFERALPVDLVFQELDDLPTGLVAPAERQKPWGTAHALWACRNAVHTPFAVINADDFYGRRSYALLAERLRESPSNAARYAMTGFILRNTLSEHGSVARGICRLDDAGELKSVVEHPKIERGTDGLRSQAADGAWRPLTGDETVSMNFWGFNPTIFPYLENSFKTFLRASTGQPKAECYLPAVVDELIRRGAARVQVLKTPEHWLGVTYTEDKSVVADGIRALVARGEYPASLWG